MNRYTWILIIIAIVIATFGIGYNKGYKQGKHDWPVYPDSLPHHYLLRSYQLKLNDSTVTIYNCDRIVAEIKADSQLNEILIKDNE